MLSSENSLFYLCDNNGRNTKKNIFFHVFVNIPCLEPTQHMWRHLIKIKVTAHAYKVSKQVHAVFGDIWAGRVSRLVVLKAPFDFWRFKGFFFLILFYFSFYRSGKAPSFISWEFFFFFFFTCLAFRYCSFPLNSNSHF